MRFAYRLLLPFALLALGPLALPNSARALAQGDGGSAPSLSQEPVELFDPAETSDSPVVRKLLAENSGSELIICIAGCRGGGKPVVLLKRPAKAAAGAEIGIQPVGGLAKVRNDDSASNVTTDVICLAGCVGSTGAKVFKGRQMAWIQQDGLNSLAHAMADLAISMQPSDQATAEPVRTWV